MILSNGIPTAGMREMEAGKALQEQGTSALELGTWAESAGRNMRAKTQACNFKD
jgi:hypothetical protein